MSHAIAARNNINLNFRPASFFQDVDPHTLVVASILGEERRKDVQERLSSGDFNPLVWGEWMTESKLDASTRDLFGKVVDYHAGLSHFFILH